MTRGGFATTTIGGPIDSELPTTAGILAVVNLQAQIEGLQQEAAVGRLAVNGQAELIELVALRAHVLGRIADYEWAFEIAEHLTHDATPNGVAFLARARARAGFHLFPDALSDL